MTTAAFPGGPPATASGSRAPAIEDTPWVFWAGLRSATVSVGPNVPRAYRCFGYPVVPLLFVASSVMMTVLSIMADWKTCLMWIGVLLAGIPVYLVWSRVTVPQGRGDEETE